MSVGRPDPRGAPPAPGPRVLMHPHVAEVGGNPYVEGVADAARRCGVTVAGYTRRSLLQGYDAVHVNWPEQLEDLDSPGAWHRALRTLGALRLARARGARIVWTGHNLGAHDAQEPRHAAFERAFLRLVTDVVVLSPASRELLLDRFPMLRGARFHVVPHGHYRDAYPPAPARQQARRALGLAADAPVVLRFGRLRPYKGVEGFAEAARPLAAAGVCALVAGEPSPPAYADVIRAALDQVPGARFLPARVPPERVPLLLGAADVVDATYPPGTSLNSGVALLALSFDRPVVVRDTPVMRDLAGSVAPGWVHLAAEGRHPDALWAALEAAERLRGQRPDLAAYEWDAIGAALRRVYAGSDPGG